jgi:iron complex transport system substrate-binding protein
VPVVRFAHPVPSTGSQRLARAVLAVMALGAAATQAGCRADTPTQHTALTDDFGDTLVVASSPARIVSLNPTTTELLFAIGAGPRVVGRTHWDIWPREVSAVPDLGPGIRPNVEAVIAAHPDLVLLYASQDNRDAARRLRAAGIRTASYKLDRIADFRRVTGALGTLTGDTAAARVTADTVTATLDRVRAATASLPHPRVFWPLWENPLLGVGGGSFLNELLQIAGARNVYDSLPQPSPTVAFEDLLRRDPDVVLVNPSSRARILADPRWRTLRAVREGHVMAVDTTIVNGPSNRVGTSAVSLANLFHPGVVK